MTYVFRTPIIRSLAAWQELVQLSRQNEGHVPPDAVTDIRPIDTSDDLVRARDFSRVYSANFFEAIAPNFQRSIGAPLGDESGESLEALINDIFPLPESVDDLNGGIYRRRGLPHPPIGLVGGQPVLTPAVATYMHDRLVLSAWRDEYMGRRSLVKEDISLRDVHGERFFIPGGTEMTISGLWVNPGANKPFMTLSGGGVSVELDDNGYVDYMHFPQVEDTSFIEGLTDAWQKSGSLYLHDVVDLDALHIAGFMPPAGEIDAKVIKVDELNLNDLQRGISEHIHIGYRHVGSFRWTGFGRVFLFDETRLQPLEGRMSRSGYRDVVTSLFVRQLSWNAWHGDDEATASLSERVDRIINWMPPILEPRGAHAFCQQISYLKGRGFDEAFIADLCVDLMSEMPGAKTPDLLVGTAIPHLVKHHARIQESGDPMLWTYLDERVARRQFRVRHTLYADTERGTIIPPRALVTVTRLDERDGTVFAKVRVDADPDQAKLGVMAEQAGDAIRRGADEYLRTGRLPPELVDASMFLAGVEDDGDDDRLTRLKKGAEAEVLLGYLMEAVDLLTREPYLGIVD